MQGNVYFDSVFMQFDWNSPAQFGVTNLMFTFKLQNYYEYEMSRKLQTNSSQVVRDEGE